MYTINISMYPSIIDLMKFIIILKIILYHIIFVKIIIVGGVQSYQYVPLTVVLIFSFLNFGL
jgi:hypothetical protein